MARKRKRYGEIRHDIYKASRASLRGRSKKLPVVVTISRDLRGLYCAMAHAASRGRGFKGKHSGDLTCQASPTKAAATALHHLASRLGHR